VPQSYIKRRNYPRKIVRPVKDNARTVAIIGLGLIGGSLAFAIRKNLPEYRIVGYDRKAVLAKAIAVKAIDEARSSVGEAVRDADVVFLCAPVGEIAKQLPAVAQNVPETAVVSDVGSVKLPIMYSARRWFRSKSVFIGGHPMTGSERSGLGYADPLLFQNAVYVLTPLRPNVKIPPLLLKVLEAIGARVLVMDAQIHDHIAAVISHVPQLIAVAMMNRATRENSIHPATLQLAAGGFRDITRIASSPYRVWNDILALNQTEILKAIREFQKVMNRFASHVSSNSTSKLRDVFDEAKRNRDVIPKSSKGFLRPLHEIYVWVPDKPGMLAKIASVLGRAGVNISDIELLKIREGMSGTFRVGFESASMAMKAASILKRSGIRVE
jgi:prephenate dehydrogenase